VVKGQEHELKEVLNLWPARKLQKVIGYKAALECIKVLYTNPSGLLAHVQYVGQEWNT